MDAIRKMARQQRISTEQVLKAELAAIANRDTNAFLGRLRKIREEQRATRGRVGPDSTPGIRDEREARW